jgi:hypothetical protein
VLAREDMPIEAPVLDLVLPEAADLRVRHAGGKNERRRNGDDALASRPSPRRAAGSHGAPREAR